MATATPGYNPPITSSGGDPVLDDEDYWKSQALNDLGLDPDDMFWFWHPIYAVGLNGLPAPIAGGTGTAAGQLQAVRVDSGGTSGGFYKVVTSTPGQGTKLFAAGAAKKVWMASRFALIAATYESGSATGVAANDLSTGEVAVVGVRGASSTANFVAWADTGGAFINSGVALDTAMRAHKWRYNGTTSVYTLDGVDVGSSVMRISANAVGEVFTINNTNASRAADFRWMAFAALRES